MALYIYKNNEQLGPYEDSAVADGLRDGRFLPNDMACPEGAKDWLPLSTLFPSETPVQSMLNSQQTVRHDIPKCLSCGAITPWEARPDINLSPPHCWYAIDVRSGCGLLLSPDHFSYSAKFKHAR